LAFYVQGYNNVNAAGGDAPPACISNANVVTGTDILVIRRAGTVAVQPADRKANEVYIQANADSTNPANPVIAFGAFDETTLRKKFDPVTATEPPAEIRKYHVIIYFVSPCNEPNGGGDVCTGGSDDGGRPIPTLKRLTLGLNAAGTALAMRTESIAEGIENLQIRYGIDSKDHLDDPMKRDGLPDDAFVAAPATVAQWGDVMSAQVYVLARTPERSPGWNDTKTYDLGDAVKYTPADPAYQRKLFVSQVRLVNPAGRREVP
jgi:type IV pilus assembly protein PilW